jgi:hypothetical protein
LQQFKQKPMDNLAQTHLELANQNVKEVTEAEVKTSNVGASWDNKAWNDIFEIEKDDSAKSTTSSSTSTKL